VLGEEGDKTELGQKTRLGEARDSFEDITKYKRFAVGVTEKREETKFGEGGEGDGRHINADRLRRGENDTKIIIDYVDGGHAGVSGDNEMEECIDSREGGGVGPQSCPTTILSPPIVHLTCLFLSLCTSSHFSFTTRLR
jgi:hypothetical protein